MKYLLRCTTQISRDKSILNATDRGSVRPVVAAHAGTATVEVQGPRKGTHYGT